MIYHVSEMISTVMLLHHQNLSYFCTKIAKSLHPRLQFAEKIGELYRTVSW
jgi:hypothetical protein